MATLRKRSHGEASHRGFSRLREALREDAGIDLTPGEVERVVAMAREQSALDQLSQAMTRFSALPPAAARAAQATENSIKAIDREFGLLTSVQVADLLGSSSKPDAARSLANDMRSRGELLYVRRLNKYLYPGFQFDDALGRVRPVVKQLVELAAASGWDTEDAALWLCSPTTYFDDGSRPVDHLGDAPDAVLEAARRAWGVEW
jgi:hypothetical protein